MKITRTSVTDQITSHIKECIASGKWQVGELIPSENQLSQELGVSRASVRQAIGQFTAIGVLEPKQGKGCYLKSIDLSGQSSLASKLDPASLADVKSVLEYRLLIEPWAVQRCMLLPPKELASLIEELEAQLELMREHIHEAEQFVRADLNFHLKISHASGNEIVAQSLEHIYAVTHQSQMNTHTIFGFNDGLKYHTGILKAMRAGNGQKAASLMDKHLRSALMQLEQS